jgi:hypothetical protein
MASRKARAVGLDAALAWGLVFLLPSGEQVALIEMAGKALEPGGRLLFTAPAETCDWTDMLTGAHSMSIGAPGGGLAQDGTVSAIMAA